MGRIIPSGVHYAMDPFGDGLLVSDGHHNRLLYVTLDGKISERMAFDNIVPTGLAVADEMVYVAEAGPSPHLPEDGKVVAFEADAPTATEIASGAQLLVDVEIGSDGTIYALSQGNFPEGAAGCAGAIEEPAEEPAQPNGRIVGTLTPHL